jgi:hypothetical protein
MSQQGSSTFLISEHVCRYYVAALNGVPTSRKAFLYRKYEHGKAEVYI